MIIPNMGRKTERPSIGLADALFPRVQQRVLALLFAQPERRFQSTELIRLADSGTGAVHRPLSRLAEAGWVTVHRTGNQKHYQANRACRVLAPPVNPSVMSLAEWRLKRAKRDSFAARIAAPPRLFVIGSDVDIA
jgi:hypothetical protein